MAENKVASLIEMLGDDSTADGAVKELVEIGEDAVGPLVKAFNNSKKNEVPMGVLRVLGEIWWPKGDGSFESIMENNDRINKGKPKPVSP